VNRILFEKEEIVDGLVTFSDVRAEHVLDVLHGEVGQVLKTGEVNGPIGTSEIIGVGERRRGAPAVTVRVSHGGKSLAPWVDVILAPPRPRVMKRLLPQMAAMGVGRIVLVGAEKVEKDFWGATLLKEANYRPLLIDGLMQCGTSILPTIETWKSFNRFLREGLPTFPHTRRIVAHPYGGGGLGGLDGLERLDGLDAAPLTTNHEPLITNHQPPLLLAIGPEGGWTDAEVEKLEAAGFARYSLGSRILRTDTATIALLAQLMPR